MSTALKDLYYSPDSGFLSAQKLYLKARSQGLAVTHKAVRDFIQKQLPDQLTKAQKRPKFFNTIYVDKIRDNYQLDIVIYDRYEYHHYKYILCMIDVHSRFAQCVVMTNREGGTIIAAVKKIFDVMGAPKAINCDNEFDTKEFDALMQQLEIRVYFSDPYEVNKNSVVERFNRTLATLLQRWRVGSGSYDWPKALPKLVQNYNSTYHSTIKARPIDVWESIGQNLQTRVFLSPLFKVGDKVRIKRHKKIFDKGDALTLSKEIYVVSGMKNGRVELVDESGVAVEKTYKPSTLMKVSEVENRPMVVREEQEEHKRARGEKKTERANKQAGVEKKNV